jgi:leader peptidase (prepilin peptidase) / N-methyltransferase
MTRRDRILAGTGAASFAAVALVTDQPPAALARLTLLGLALGAVASIDLREHRIPNRVVVPASIACGVLLVVEHVDLAALVPELAVVSALLLVSLVVPAALGMGDVKLALLLAIGIDGDAIVALAAGFALAAAYALLLVIREGRSAGRTALPLAPFLAIGALAATAVR